MGQAFGWSAVAGPDRMDWPTYWGARQLIAELHIGTLMRDAERTEDADFRDAKTQLERRR